MSNLLQGDFARLRARGVETTLACREFSAPSAPPPPVGPEQVVEADATPTSAAPAEGWLKRLLGTR